MNQEKKRFLSWIWNRAPQLATNMDLPPIPQPTPVQEVTLTVGMTVFNATMGEGKIEILPDELTVGVRWDCYLTQPSKNKVMHVHRSAIQKIKGTHY